MVLGSAPGAWHQCACVWGGVPVQPEWYVAAMMVGNPARRRLLAVSRLPPWQSDGAEAVSAVPAGHFVLWGVYDGTDSASSVYRHVLPCWRRITVLKSFSHPQRRCASTVSHGEQISGCDVISSGCNGHVTKHSVISNTHRDWEPEQGKRGDPWYALWLVTVASS